MPRRATVPTSFIAILVAVVVVVATVAFVSLTHRPSTPPQSSSSNTGMSGQSNTSLSNAGKSSTSSYTVSSAVSTETALLAQCPSSQPPSYQDSEQPFGTVVAGTGSPAIICVQLYYYAAAPLTLNLTNTLSIQALQYVYNGSVGNPRSFSGASNFTVSVSQPQLALGGPTNEGEGTIVAYAVTANAGASGTYELGFLPSSSLNTWMLGAQEPKQCGYYGQLVAGNGQPSYVQPTGCITYTTTNQSNSTETSSSGNPTISGIPYQLISGDVYFRIVGVTNSTG